MDHNMPNPKIDVERVNEVKKAHFWVSQIFILIAIVLGVFLASQQGYKQAVQFENTVSDKNNYYLQKSLQYELQDNLAILKDYITHLQDPSYLGVREEPINFHTLVWENMKFSQITLSTPSEFLRDTQRFYHTVANTHAKLAKGQIATSIAIKTFQEQIDTIENSLIPLLEKSTASIEQKLKGTDIIL